MAGTKMTGWWDKANAVQTDRDGVKATTYTAPGRANRCVQIQRLRNLQSGTPASKVRAGLGSAGVWVRNDEVACSTHVRSTLKKNAGILEGFSVFRLGGRRSADPL